CTAGPRRGGRRWCRGGSCATSARRHSFEQLRIGLQVELLDQRLSPPLVKLLEILGLDVLDVQLLALSKRHLVDVSSRRQLCVRKGRVDRLHQLQPYQAAVGGANHLAAEVRDLLELLELLLVLVL